MLIEPSNLGVLSSTFSSSPNVLVNVQRIESSTRPESRGKKSTGAILIISSTVAISSDSTLVNVQRTESSIPAESNVL